MARYRLARVVGTSGTFATPKGSILHSVTVTKFLAAGVCTITQPVAGTTVAVIDCSAMESQGSYIFDAFSGNNDSWSFAVTGGAAEVVVSYC